MAAVTAAVPSHQQQQHQEQMPVLEHVLATEGDENEDEEALLDEAF